MNYSETMNMAYMINDNLLNIRHAGTWRLISMANRSLKRLLDNVRNDDARVVFCILI